jgi:tRNA pseudouridine13 synthase
MKQPDYQITHWPRANGESVASVKIRSQPADFFVEEHLGFSLSGEGEHVYLLVEKTGQNTTVIAERLAAFAQVHPKVIGYAGLKDRNAVTRQWYSVQLPKVEKTDWQNLESDDLRVLNVSRHNKKLRKGALKYNRFKLVLRDVQGERTAIDDRLNWIKESGVPNYFGPQRFGRYGDNVDQAIAWLEGKKKSPGRYLKGIYLSAIRSFLFNEILADRVCNQIWDRGVAGDILLLRDTNSCFLATEMTKELQLRLELQDIHPALTLFGVAGLNSVENALKLEQQILNQYPVLTKALLTMKLKKAWRSSRLLVANLDWQWIDTDVLLLAFSLPPGGYATSVLAEL